MAQARRTCIFCGRLGSSREDALPIWISEALSDAAPFTLESTHGRSKVGLRRFGVYTWVVCRSCNGGWMSRLEERAKRLLGPSIRGAEASWSTLEQRDVATWALKTALMIDRSSVDAARVPEPHFRYLFDHGRPPGSVRISTALYRPEPGEEQHGATAGVGDGDREQFPGSYRILFSVGCLVFEVHGRAEVDDRGLIVANSALHASGLWIPLTSSFACIWPAQTEPVTWPPSGFALNSHSLKAVGNEPVVVPAARGRVRDSTATGPEASSVRSSETA